MDNELLQAIAQIVKNEVQPLKDEITKTNLIIENEIRPSIKLLAEGHRGVIERLDRIEAKTDEIDDIKDSVSILKALTIKSKS